MSFRLRSGTPPKRLTLFAITLISTVKERDLIYENIVLKLAGANLDTWINDLRNQGALRGWASIVERHIRHHGDPNHEPSLCPRKLMRCRKIREPSEEDWGIDLDSAHRVAVEGMWEEWEDRDWTHAAAGSNTQLDLPDLVAYTLHILGICTQYTWGWPWFFRRMVCVGNMLAWQARHSDAEIKEQLKLLCHALVQRLDEMWSTHHPDVGDLGYNRDAMLID